MLYIGLAAYSPTIASSLSAIRYRDRPQTGMDVITCMSSLQAFFQNHCALLWINNYIIEFYFLIEVNIIM